MLTVGCESCGASYQAPEKFAGRKMRCKRCSAVLEIPALEGSEPADRSTALEETAVMGEDDRREMERTRPRRGAGARKGIGAKKVGGKKTGVGPTKGGVRRGGGLKKSSLAARRGSTDSAAMPEDAPSGSGTKLLLLVLVLILVVGAGGVGVYYGFFAGDAGSTVAGTSRAAGGDSTTEMDDDDDGGGDDADATAAADDDDDIFARVDLDETMSDDDDDDDDLDEVDDVDEVGDASELPTTRVELLRLVPADVTGFLVVDLKKLKAFSDAHADNPMAQGLESMASEQPGADELSGILDTAGIDSVEDIDRLVLGVRAPSGPADTEASPPAILLVEGRFDAQRVVSSVYAESGDGSALVEGAYRFHPIDEDGTKLQIAAISRDQVVAVSPQFYDSVVQLLSGDGEGVKSNQVLSRLTQGFTKEPGIAVAVDVPTWVLDLVPQQVPPAFVNFIPSWNAVYLGFEGGGDGGFRLELLGNSKDEPNAAQQDENKLKALVNVMIGPQLPEPLKPFLKKFQFSHQGSLSGVSLALGKSDIEQLAEIAGALFASSLSGESGLDGEEDMDGDDPFGDDDDFGDDEGLEADDDGFGDDDDGAAEDDDEGLGDTDDEDLPDLDDEDL